MLFFSLFFPLLLSITAAQGGAFHGPAPLPASSPQPQQPRGTAQGPPPPPAFARTDRGVGAGCGADGQRGTGVQRSGGCVHGRGSAVRRAATCNPLQAGLGGPCCKVAARGVGGDGSLPAASREKRPGGHRCPVPGAGGRSNIHLRDPVDERLLPGRDIAAVPRVLGAGELRVEGNRERR